MSIAESIKKYKKELPGVKLVAVSKTKPASSIMEAYNAGQRDFGENKIQEMAAKHKELPKDINWHMIGHVQTNKIKYMAPFVHLVHGVDRKKVLIELNKQAANNDRIIQCLLQIHISKEETKFGLDPLELHLILKELNGLTNVKVVGLMGMSTNTSDTSIVREEFSMLKALYDKYESEFNWSVLSMGMSGDYQIAIENGSTHIRIGSAIFGARNYN